MGELCCTGLRQPGKVGAKGCARGPPFSLGGSPQRWLPNSSLTRRTIWMCPSWRVMWFPTGSLDCLCAALRAASVVGRAHRSALAAVLLHITAVLLHIDAAVCRHSSLRAGWGSGKLEVLAALLASVGGQRQGPTPWCSGGFAQSWWSLAQHFSSLAEAPLQQCLGLQLLS